jgi:hypothetical protein
VEAMDRFELIFGDAELGDHVRPTDRSRSLNLKIDLPISPELLRRENLLDLLVDVPTRSAGEARSAWRRSAGPTRSALSAGSTLAAGPTLSARAAWRRATGTAGSALSTRSAHARSAWRRRQELPQLLPLLFRESQLFLHVRMHEERGSHRATAHPTSGATLESAWTTVSARSAGATLSWSLCNYRTDHCQAKC